MIFLMYSLFLKGVACKDNSNCALLSYLHLVLPSNVTGTLKLMDSSEQLLWSVQVDHQLFALQKLDVTVSMCVCIYGGQNYCKMNFYFPIPVYLFVFFAFSYSLGLFPAVFQIC